MMTLPDRAVLNNDESNRRCNSIVIPSKILNLPLKRQSYDTIDGPPNNLPTTSDRSIPINENLQSPEFPNTTNNTCSGPRYQRYAIRDTRYNTFLRWPPSAQKSPQELSEAGFFYLGDGDNVNCFYCGGGVKNWESTDDAWIEHAKWYPECKFLELMKGKEYVKNIPRPPTHEINISPLVGGQRLMTPGSYDIPPQGDVVYTHNHPLIESGITKIINMGFDSIFIQHVIAEQVRRTGSNFSTYEQLLNAVLDLDPNRTETPPPFDETTPPRSAATPPNASLASLSIEPLTGSSFCSQSMSQSNITPNSESGENIQCKICMDNEANVCFLPCGHLVACGHCSMALDLCPICRSAVADRIRVFLS